MEITWLNESFLSWLPPTDIKIADWLEQNINLPELTCPEHGRLRLTRTPYVRGPILAFESPYIEEIDLVWGRQLAKSTFIYNCLCYVICQDPGPAVMLFPGKDLARYTSKDRLKPQFDISLAVCEQKTNDSDDYGTFEMKFKNMPLSLVWAGSGSQVMSRPARYALLDEIDEMKETVGEGESDPITSIIEATSNFIDRMIIKTSTPSKKNKGIWKSIGKCQRIFEYWLQCPFCGERQLLIWPQIKWPKEQKDSEAIIPLVYYECYYCQKHIRNNEKILMLESGKWHSRPNATELILRDQMTPFSNTISLEETLNDHNVTKIGFQLPKWYSPFEHGSIGAGAKAFIDAQEDYNQLRDWTKFWKAQPFVKKIQTAEYTDMLKNKINLPPLICPEDTKAIIATVDPGQGGFWFLVAAWREDCSPHIIQYGFMHSWDNVTKLVNESIYSIYKSEQFLHIWRFGIDTGGSKYEEDLTMTQAAYIWLRNNSRQNIYGVKGASRENKSGRRVTLSIVDKIPGYTKDIIPGGVAIWLIDTEAFKDAIQYYLSRPKGSSKRITFHSETKQDLLDHLLSEEKQPDKKGEYHWVQVKKHNHLLDCLVYNFALADQECLGGVRILPPLNYSAPYIEKEKAREAKADWLAGIDNF